MKAVVAAFTQEKALVGAFSVITNLLMDLFEVLTWSSSSSGHQLGDGDCSKLYELMFTAALLSRHHIYKIHHHINHGEILRKLKDKQT